MLALKVFLEMMAHRVLKVPKDQKEKPVARFYRTSRVIRQ
jgi:hypothetical protein